VAVTPLNTIDLGKRIAEKREAADKTQMQLADEVGVNQGTVCDWELGRFRPRTEKWNVLADALGTSITELFFDDTPADTDTAA
jgi:transcriptional regulator with XRE-family HTH domain